MANTIKIKKSSVAAKVPVAADLLQGELAINTTDEKLYSKNSSGAVFEVGTAGTVNGTAERTVYTATAAQTTFATTYDTGFVDVYLNGIKLQVTADFSDSSGTNVVLTTGATVGDIVDIIAYGTFNVANVYTPATADAKFAQVANNLSDVASAATTRTNLGLAIGTDVQAYDATIVVDADIGTTVQAYDATIVVDADIGTTVQAYDATILVDADIGTTVQAYDATIVVDADIGTTVQAYDANKYPAPIITSSNIAATNASFHIASAGGITITLPATPTAGNYVIIKDGTGAAAGTPFTVARNGSNIASSATDLTFDKNFAEVVMTYVNATIGWSV